jgi:hypothetical protein
VTTPGRYLIKVGSDDLDAGHRAVPAPPDRRIMVDPLPGETGGAGRRAAPARPISLQVVPVISLAT